MFDKQFLCFEEDTKSLKKKTTNFKVQRLFKRIKRKFW